MNMREAKEELMHRANGKYHSISYELTDRGNGDASQKCRVYIDGIGGFEANHWEEALTSLENAMSGKPTISEDLPISTKKPA